MHSYWYAGVGPNDAWLYKQKSLDLVSSDHHDLITETTYKHVYEPYKH